MWRVGKVFFWSSLFLCLLWKARSAPEHLDAYGHWRSTTGDRYRLVPTPRGSELEIISSVGESRACRARWLEDGQAFAFSEAGGRGMAVATYRREHDALELKEPQGTSWLRREGKQKPAGPGVLQTGTPASSR